jgi:putative heme transporter
MTEPAPGEQPTPPADDPIAADQAADQGHQGSDSHQAADANQSGGAEQTGKARRRSHWPKWLPLPVRRATKILIFAFVVQFLVLPSIDGTRKALHELGKVDVFYLIAGAGFEAAAIVSYAFLTRAVLPREDSPSVLTLLRVQLSTLGFSHVAPGGAAAGTPLGYRLLTHAGVEPPDAGFALATQGMGSAVVLNVILWLALVVSIPLNGFNPVYLTAAVIGVIAIGGFAVLVVSLTRGEERSARVLSALASHLPLVNHEAVTDLVHKVAERLRQLGTDRDVLIRAGSWAAANWLLDAASLWVFVAAFGHRVSIVGLLVAFGLANVLAAIPITPGGLGVIEAVLTSTLVGFGTPSSVAILGVASYRLLNFWLPIPLGGMAYISLKVDPGDPDGTVLQQRKDRVVRKIQQVWQSMSGVNESRSNPPSA